MALDLFDSVDTDMAKILIDPVPEARQLVEEERYAEAAEETR